MIRAIGLLVVVLNVGFLSAQKTFSDNMFYQLVVKNHPLAKQANLELEYGRVSVLKAKGGFDPKVFNSLNQKYYNSTQYYSLLDAGLKVPTWYGLELKTGFENYKNYSNFDGILMMNNNSESVQYFTSYESMQGLIKSDVAYMMAPDSEGMPKVDLIAIASTGVDVKALRKAERAAAKASAQPAFDPEKTRLQVTRKGRQAEPRDKDSTPRQRRDK